MRVTRSRTPTMAPAIRAFRLLGAGAVGSGAGGRAGIRLCGPSLIGSSSVRATSDAPTDGRSGRLGQGGREERQGARVPVRDRHMATIEQLERVLGAGPLELLGYGTHAVFQNPAVPAAGVQPDRAHR